MRQKLELYNHYHYGDIFFSRIIIEILREFYDITYYHNLKTPLLPDYDNVTEISGIPSYLSGNHSNLVKNQINTWIGQDNFKYLRMAKEGCCFENYMCIINEILEYYHIPKKPKQEYFPIVNFDKITNILQIDVDIKRLKNLYHKIVLISNGDTHSGQSLNFSFEPIIQELSLKHPNILFLITEPINTQNNNIIFTSEITKTSPDLLQISYISKFCDVVVGRSSGPYSYCMIKENLLDENKVFISFNNNITESNYYENSKCKTIWSNNYNFNHVLDTISDNL